MSEKEWKPNKELSEWAKNHFKEMNVGGVWMPDGSGLTYRKEDEKSWALVQMLDSDESRDNHERMKVLMWDVGIGINDDDYKTLPQPQSEHEAHMMDVQMKRELAQSWTDKDGTSLTDMDLESIFPEYVENKEILLEDGNTTTIEIWAYKALNPNTDEYISIDPDDYHLLMGDEMFMRFKHDGVVYTAMSREMMVHAIDNAEPECTGVGSTVIEGVGGEPKIPPWLWGTYCSIWHEDEEQTTLDDFIKSEEE
jgi:hypothetical protein|tara:strand:+ start:10474 stop:11229 length:756 start_codon:yes stop_codon:yes gene_type:complete